MLGLSFYFSDEALEKMADDIRMIPTLKTVTMSSDFNRKALRDLLGEKTANSLTEELQLFGVVRSLPQEYNYRLLLNDINLVWNPNTMSFVSQGKIGIGFIGNQPLNVYVDGWVELQRKRSGDLLDIYLKANDNTWYWFSYVRGILMSYSSNMSYNDLLSSIKERQRKDPDARGGSSFQYMVGLPDRLERFLRRMESGGTGYDENYY